MPIEKLLYVVSDHDAAGEQYVTLIILRIFAKVDSSQTEHFRHLLTIAKAMQIDQVQNW